MNQNFTSYLSLGSNEGSRATNLQDAVNNIHSHIGNVLMISGIYKTPAWGFDGDDFYNICIKIKTKHNPQELLSKILALELELGRKRKDTIGYQNRNIDIDIILFENYKIETDALQIPHPRAIDRKFVLIPLQEIYKEAYLPFNNQNINENCLTCIDNNPIEKITETVYSPKKR